MTQFELEISAFLNESFTEVLTDILKHYSYKILCKKLIGYLLKRSLKVYIKFVSMIDIIKSDDFQFLCFGKGRN